MIQPVTFENAEIAAIAQYCDLTVDEKLTFVNKKYGETITNMTEIPYLHLKSTYDIKQCQAIKRSFKVFENAEECCLYSTFLTQFNEFGCVEYMFTEEFQRMQQIHLIGLPESQEAIYMMQEQITKISAPLCYYDDLDLSEYPNVREITLDFGDDAFDFKHIFSGLFEPLEVLRIKNFNDVQMLHSLLNRACFARKIFVYVDNEKCSNEDIEKLSSLRNIKVIVKRSEYEVSSLDSSDEYVESDDECDFYNDDFIYYDETTEENNTYMYNCLNDTEDSLEQFVCNDYSSESMDCGHTFFTKVDLSSSMSDNECMSYEMYHAERSPCFIPSQLQ